jgi:cell division protein FtsQ
MKRWIWAVGAIVLVGAILVYTEFRQKEKVCQSVIVKLDENAEYPFFTEEDIQKLVSLNGLDRVEGMRLKDINLKGLEKRVLKNRLIKNCQIYQDLSGNLVVEIQQQRPVGRLISVASDQEKQASKGGYLTETADIVQLSPRFAARTVLVSGEFFNNPHNLKTIHGLKLVAFLKDVQQNPFWKAQIAEVIVARDGEITLLPQVGQHQVDFGLPDGTEIKLEKLKVFYKTILPLKGWDKYKRVSVKFRNQIVCE